MRDIPFDVVAFDLDGTLADTAPDLAASLNHALKALGREGVDPAKVRDMVGHGAKALLRKALAATAGPDEALVERGYPIFIDFYGANICEGTRLYPGVEEALDALRAAGVAAAICTNKPEGLTHKLLAALGWEGRFDAIVGGDSLPVRKPDPAPLLLALQQAGGGRAAFVGDSIIDADTARAADVPFVAVGFGFSDRPAEELGADAVIGAYDELLAALGGLPR